MLAVDLHQIQLLLLLPFPMPQVVDQQRLQVGAGGLFLEEEIVRC